MQTIQQKGHELLGIMLGKTCKLAGLFGNQILCTDTSLYLLAKQHCDTKPPHFMMCFINHSMSKNQVLYLPRLSLHFGLYLVALKLKSSHQMQTDWTNMQTATFNL